MHKTRGMWKAMVAEGYKEKTKMLTRAQVRTIVQFLGEPWWTRPQERQERSHKVPLDVLSQ